ncbi:MAG: D-alanyl-D-alanine carboxypeptidase/D-alanyl-D-alanine endopeptidase [Paracoccaceae bacterium]
MTGNTFSRRAVLGGLLAGIGQAGWTSAPDVSQAPLLRPPGLGNVALPGADKLIKRAALGGKLGYVVADAATGRVLETFNPSLRLPPASVAKAMTAQYALETLGAEHTFATRLVAVGSILGGKLDGDLVLLGGGDPTLNTNALAEMAAALKATGLREVSGRFLVHRGALPHVHQIDSGQPAYLGYNPAVSGLNLNYNRVYFEWKLVSGIYKVTMDARSGKYRPEVAVTRMQVVDRNGPVYTYSNGGLTDQWTVAKSALGNQGSRWLPVRQPALYAGEVFQIFAFSQGIVLKAPQLDYAVVDGTILVDRQSPALAVILKSMLARSNNLTAEVMGLSASVARGGSVSGLRQSASEMSGWMKNRLGATTPRFVDHSGLGDKSRISASDMVAAMLSVGPDSRLASILKPINMRDAKGNLRQGSGITMRAKTGTLNFVSGLSGFIKTSDASDLVFAIFAADLPRRAVIPLENRERPPGARGWSRRARALQWGLIDRWVRLYN